MKVKKYISIFLGLCGLGLMPVGTYAKTIVNPVMVNPFAKIESDIAQVNKQFAEMNNDTVKMGVTLEKSVNPPVIVYEIIMLTVAENSPEAEALKAMNLNMIEVQQLETLCGSPQTKELIDTGINYRFVYKDKNNNDLNVMNIDLANCPK